MALILVPVAISASAVETPKAYASSSAAGEPASVSTALPAVKAMISMGPSLSPQSGISEEGGGKRRDGGSRSPIVHSRNVGSIDRCTDVSDRRRGIAR